MEGGCKQRAKYVATPEVQGRKDKGLNKSKGDQNPTVFFFVCLFFVLVSGIVLKNP